jgi:hypothetical protein
MDNAVHEVVSLVCLNYDINLAARVHLGFGNK